ALTGAPSTSTVQAPHSPSPQPSLVPVSPQSSRNTSSSRFIGWIERRRALRFSVKRIIFFYARGAPPPRAEDLALERRLSRSDNADMIFSGVAGISRRSAPAWRSALTIAGAGPSIGISPTPLAPNGPCLYGRSITTTSIGGVSSVVGTM